MFKLKIRMQIYVIINKLTVASTIAYMQFSINNEWKPANVAWIFRLVITKIP